MQKKTHCSSKHYFEIKNYLVILILFASIFLVYSNTFFSSWHLDDFPNIVHNSTLHIQKLTPSSIYQTFFANPTHPGSLFRPISCLSFALNWLIGRDNVVGFHLVNITVHFLTSYLLYLTILLLLTSPKINDKYTDLNKQIISLVAVLLWALNPIQSQAITYIVQRMASLAGLFYVGSIYFYIKGRCIKNTKYKAIIYYIFSLLSFILALGSKENAIMLPFSLILIEIIFFRYQRGAKYILKNRYLLLLILVLLLLIIIPIIFLNINIYTILSGYGHRGFNLSQRLMTEPRIVLYYLSQIFYPISNRFSLDHDIIISTSLTNPPTTIISILILSISTLLSITYHKKYPIISFSILYFIINHIIESTIIPLELIFEHRNYIPSMFLFLPISISLSLLINRSDYISNSGRIFLRSFIIITIILVGFSTYNRNLAWKSEQSLWEDSLSKAPLSSRPYINLANVYRRLGYNNIAFGLCYNSLNKYSSNSRKDRMRAYNNMGIIMMDYNNFNKAVIYFRNADKINPNINTKYYLHQALLANKKVDMAKKILDELIRLFPNDSHLLVSMGIVHTIAGNYTNAESLFNRAKSNSKQDLNEQIQATICLGSLYSRTGKYKKAEQIFTQIQPLTSSPVPTICLIGNELKQKKLSEAMNLLDNLRKHVSDKEILSLLRTSYRANLLFPVDAKNIEVFIANQLITSR